MLVAIPAVAVILAVVAGQARVLSRTRSVAPAAAARAAPAVVFRRDPLGWVVEQLRFRRWGRRSLSAGSLVVLLVAVGIIGYPFYTNLVQSRIQARLEHQLSSPELNKATPKGQAKKGKTPPGPKTS